MFSTRFDRQYISCSLEYLVLRTLQLLYTVDSPSCTLSSRAYPTRSEVSSIPNTIISSRAYPTRSEANACPELISFQILIYDRPRQVQK